MGEEDSYPEGWDHERPVAGAAPPSSEGMNPSVRSISVLRHLAHLHFVGNLI